MLNLTGIVIVIWLKGVCVNAIHREIGTGVSDKLRDSGKTLLTCTFNQDGVKYESDAPTIGNINQTFKLKLKG